MRRLLPLAALVLLVAALRAEEGKKEEASVREEVVKAVRAVLSEKDAGRREKMLAELKARPDLDWPSVRKGFQEGPYYQKPLVTEFGTRHSKMHFDEVWTGDDGKPRGYSLWVPSAYDPKEAPLPVLFYLHHDASNAHQGSEIAGTAVLRFRDTCERNGILFVAPYTTSGAEWWTPQGRRLVEWTLRKVKERYSVDEDRIALVGSMDGGDSVWYLGQEMPGTWSCLMPMTGDPLDLSAVIRPLYLGTLDRMDVLLGVAGVTRGFRGEVGASDYLQALKPLLDKNMRITAAVYTDANSDFRYLEKIVDQIASWVLTKKRTAFAKEVDVESDAPEGLRSLWLEGRGPDPGGDSAHELPSTRLVWKAPESREPERKLGLSWQPRPKWPLGLAVTKVELGAREANVLTGDIVLSVAGTEVREGVDMKPLLAERAWDSDVPCVFAREVKASQLKRLEAVEANYRKKVRELRADDPEKPLPRDLWKQVQEMETDEEEEEAEEEEDDGTTSIEVAGEGGSAPGPGKAADESEETHVFVYERWVKLLRPEPMAIARADFGATRDPAHAPGGRDQSPDGVRIQWVTPGSLADRCGLKTGDIVVQVGADEVKNATQLRTYFDDFRFEEEPQGERFVEITVKRRSGDGQWSEHTVKPRWDPPAPYRVDVKWDAEEKTFEVLARQAVSFTIHFADDLIPPGEPFHVFINGVPYQDLADPASAPDYPELDAGSDPGLGHRLHEMRLKRAKVEGWQPDLAWAIDDGLAARDRKLVVGGRRTFDLTALKGGFAKARERREARATKRGTEIRDAYDRHRARE